ncbi:MAG: shikimate dehydrogenase [Dysgonamonadaceae bacterium]|jgi:shikimate dehydrogenase|nr:shikimate dehydrogenase [Dysgonamonadaceae bacterium]
MKQYGLIGNPLKHSFSRKYFNDKFDAEKIDAEYINFEIPTVKDAESIIKNRPLLAGLNVTIPYKEKIIPYLDKLSENAKLIGAVNVIKIDRTKGKPRLTGHNTDIIGFKQSIEQYLKPNHRRALVLGSGGAAKAIYWGLKQLNITPVYVSREKRDRAMLTYNDLNAEIMETHTVIVNCTPVGMYPDTDECPQIPCHYLYSEHLIYDLLYNPDETMLMKRGKEHGATVVNGLEMLLLQAFASWSIWNS